MDSRAVFVIVVVATATHQCLTTFSCCYTQPVGRSVSKQVKRKKEIAKSNLKSHNIPKHHVSSSTVSSSIIYKCNNNNNNKNYNR